MNEKQEKRRRRLHDRAVKYYRDGTTKRWVTCLVASRYVGQFSKGLTAALATDLALSVDQVENLARAGIVYRRMRRFASDLPEIRRKLTYSHFAAMGELAIKHDLTPVEIIEQLREAADKGMSVEIMRGTIGKGDNEPGTDWIKLLTRARKNIEHLCQVGGIPTGLWELCDEFLQRSEEFIE